MKNLIIAFDVDGTLISNSNGLGMEHLNIDVFNMMVLFARMKNTRIIVWSGGGKEYVEQMVNKYGLNRFVDACHSKHEYDEGIDGHVDIAFDDQHEFALADKNVIVRMK